MSGAQADITILNLNLFYLRFPEGEDRIEHLPLGPLYATAALEQAGFTVDFRDYQTRPSPGLFTADALVRFLDGAAPVVGFSCMTNLLPFTLLGMQAFKRAHPDRTLVLAGVGPVAVEQRILERFDWVDVIVRGEAEISAPLLLDALSHGEDLSRVPGVSYRDRGRVRHNPKPPRIQNLDAAPGPALAHVDLSRFAGLGIVTSRGCPFRCRFCSVAEMWDHRACFRSVEHVVAEMQRLHETAGAELFLFQDDLFVSSKARVRRFCAELRRSGLRVEWKAMGRVDLVDEPLMREMADCGCIDLRFGIESGSDGVLWEIRKGVKGPRTAEVVRQACAIFPRVDLFYVWGFPFETIEAFYETAFQMVAFRMLGANIVPLLLCHLPQCEIGAGADADGMEFAPDLVPESLSSGVEVYRDAHVTVPAEQRFVFDFIEEHPDIFPGWFHRDVETNIRPKLKVLQELGFYPPPYRERDAAA